MNAIKKLVEEIIGSREAPEPKPWQCPICGHDTHYEIGSHDRFGWGTSRSAALRLRRVLGHVR